MLWKMTFFFFFFIENMKDNQIFKLYLVSRKFDGKHKEKQNRERNNY